MRDITLEDTFYHAFSTRQFSTGAPFALASGVLSVKEGANATPITAGVSVSLEDPVAGMHEATIVATAANGYEAGKSYSIYISTGTVDSVSVVGEVVGQFTIAASAAAVDLANATDGLGAIKAETAAIVNDTDVIDDATSGLVKIASDVAATLADTADMQPKLGTPAGADMSADIAAVKTETAAIVNDTDVIDDATSGLVKIASDVAAVLVDTADMQPKLGTPAGADISTDIAAVKTETAAIVNDTDIIDDATSGLVKIAADVATVLVDTADMQPKLGTPAGADVSADIAAIKTETAAIVNDTDVIDDATSGLVKIAADVATVLVDTADMQPKIGTPAADVSADIAAVKVDTGTTIPALLPAALVGGRMDCTIDGTGMEAGAIDAILQRQITEGYNTDGSAPTVEQALMGIFQGLTEFAIAGTTLTVKQLDGSATAMTFTLDDATNPTSRTRAT